jgi:hypothetical protein
MLKILSRELGERFPSQTPQSTRRVRRSVHVNEQKRIGGFLCCF